MVSFSQVSVKHRAAEFEKSLFVWESRRSSSVLLGRERRFARWMLGNGVLNPCWRSFTSAPARFPRLRVLQRLNNTAAPPTTMSSKTSEWSKSSKRFCGVFCRMFSSSSLVKLIVFEKQKNRKNKEKQYEHWRAKHCSCRVWRHLRSLCIRQGSKRKLLIQSVWKNLTGLHKTKS